MDPDYYALIRRERIEQLAAGDDWVARWTSEMLGSMDGEEEVFVRGARGYLESCDRAKRKKAIGYFAALFGVNHKDMKRYLRFKGLVNLMD